MAEFFADSRALRETIAQECDGKCLLSFSCGKDSIAAWLALREQFHTIIPFFLEEVPGLSFVRDALTYYEEWFETPIIRLPHPSFYRQLRNLVFQPPERCAAIEAADIPKLDYQKIENAVRRSAGLPGAYVAIGTRTADSPIRLANVRRYGAVNRNRKSFFAIYDWRIADVERIIVDSGVRLPVDYEMFGRSFDGIDYRFLAPIRERFPDDYQRILDWFPLADLEIFRREHAR